MPHIDTINRLFAILKRLEITLKKPANISLAQTFRGNRIPAEYCKYVISEGLIIKIDKGRRGPSTYVWNKEIQLTKQIAENLILKFNETRRTQLLKREMEGPSKPGQLSVSDRLIKVEELLNRIVKKLNA